MLAPDCSPLVKQFSCRRCRHPSWSRLRRRSFQRCFARRSGSPHNVDPIVILSRVSAPISFRAWWPHGFRRRWAIDNLSPRDATIWKQRKRFPWSFCGPICSELRSDETFFVSSRSHDVLWQRDALEKFRVLDLGRLVDAHEKKSCWSGSKLQLCVPISMRRFRCNPGSIPKHTRGARTRCELAVNLIKHARIRY